MIVRRIGRYLFVGGAVFCTGIAVSIPAAAEGARVSEQAVVEEVIVTARKREERAIDTPVAVSVMDGDELDLYNECGGYALTPLLLRPHCRRVRAVPREGV